jgi:hypothetical protein
MAFGGNPELRLLNKERSTRSMEDIADTILPLHAACAKQLKEAAIKRENFKGFYNQKTMNMHQTYVRECEAYFAANNRAQSRNPDQLSAEDTKKMSEVLEFFVFSGINRAGWLPFIKAIKTCDYDDYRHKIDLVLEFISKATVGHIGLGIDVTFSNDIDKKCTSSKMRLTTTMAKTTN